MSHAWAAASLSTTHPHEWHMLLQVIQQVSFLKSYLKRKAPEQSLWERKEKNFICVFTSCLLFLLPHFTLWKLMVLGFRVAFPGPMGCPPLCPITARGARNSLSVSSTAAQGLAPLVLQEDTGHPQTGRNVEGRTSSWGCQRWWNQGNLGKHIQCIPYSSVVWILIF